MNMNDIAKRVTLLESGKTSISIAQVKEVLGIAALLMATDSEVHAALLNYGTKLAKKERIYLEYREPEAKPKKKKRKMKK